MVLSEMTAKYNSLIRRIWDFENLSNHNQNIVYEPQSSLWPVWPFVNTIWHVCGFSIINTAAEKKDGTFQINPSQLSNTRERAWARESKENLGQICKSLGESGNIKENMKVLTTPRSKLAYLIILMYCRSHGTEALSKSFSSSPFDTQETRTDQLSVHMWRQKIIIWAILQNWQIQEIEHKSHQSSGTFAFWRQNCSKILKHPEEHETVEFEII